MNVTLEDGLEEYLRTVMPILPPNFNKDDSMVMISGVDLHRLIRGAWFGNFIYLDYVMAKTPPDMVALLKHDVSNEVNEYVKEMFKLGMEG